MSTQYLHIIIRIISTLSCIFLFTAEIFAENLYLSQTGSGSRDGLSLANAWSVTEANSASSWSSPAKVPGKIGPGDTLYINGVITSQLVIQASGTTGNVITIQFAAGAKMSAPTWTGGTSSSAGAININAKDYITIDGGGSIGMAGPDGNPALANGIIECSDNGTALGNQINSTGICATSSSNLTIRNLVIRNLYIRTRGAEQNSYGTGIQNTAKNNASYSNFRVTNCILHDMYRGVDNDYPPDGASNIEIDNCTIYNVNWGGRIGDRSPTSKFSGYLKFHDNRVYDFLNWDDTSPSNSFHHNAYYAWAEQIGAVNSFTGIASFYNNTIGPNFYTGSGTNHATAGLFMSGKGMSGTAIIYNNLFLENGSDYPSNGLVFIDAADGFTGHIYNNTFIGGGGGIAVNIDGHSTDGGSQSFYIKNNIGTNLTFLSVFRAAPILLYSDKNIGYNLRAGAEYNYSTTNSSTFLNLSQWRVLGYDLNSSTDSPTFLSPGVDYRLAPTDTAATDTGVDLSAFFTFDNRGGLRPSGIGWDIGAFELAQTTPTIMVQPVVTQAVAVTGSATFTVLARGQAPLTYQWKKNGSNVTDGGIVSGATTPTLTLTGVGPSDAGTYTVEVNNALGPSVTSTGSILTVGATAPSITTQPAVTQSVTWGTTVNFTVTATGVPSPSFQWKKDGVNLTDGGIVSGATSSTLTLTGVTGTYAGTYTVVVDNAVPPSVTSNNSVLVVNGIPVAITSQPASQAVLLGNPVNFSVSATGTPAPTFQWNKNNVPIPGATGSIYTIGSSTANDAGSYSVTVTNIVGSVTSSTATLSVSVVPVPTITSQPVALTVAAGRNVGFQIATVDAVSFQWQESSDGGATWHNLINDATYSGVTGKTLTIANAPLTLNGRLYRAQAGNGTGGATSNAVTLGVVTPVFPSPVAVVISPQGNLLVSDRTQNVIQSVNTNRVANLLAGVPNQQGTTNGNGNIALFRQPGGAVLDTAGNLYVADTGNSIIRKITPTGTVSTLAGSSTDQSYRDGNGTNAWFNSPSSITIDGSGSLFVADTGNSVIRKIDPAGNVTTFAGTAGVRGSVDGNGPAARFNQPTGIAADNSGNLYVTDTLNQTVRKISPGGAVSTLAGLVGVSGTSDGTGAEALFNNPLGITVDNAGNIFVADSGNSAIRRITQSGTVSTYAGLPTISGLLDGTGPDTWFNQPIGLDFDSAGNLYVADNGNAAIRTISSARVVNTLVITQGSTPIPTPPPTTPSTTPTPIPPTSPTPTQSSGGGGGGGAPSIWFIAATSLFCFTRHWTRRQPAIE